MAKLYVAFLWHMHQPLYKDELKQRYHLPWVRLHALKGYYDMPGLLEKFPSMKVTFNLTPSLLYQIQDYLNNPELKDDFLIATLKPASELTPDDKEFILRHFFMNNWPRIVKPHPRYSELLGKRGGIVSRDELRKKIPNFSDQELLDLQVLFNLSWFGFRATAKEARVRDLIQKRSHYTEEDKREMIELQTKILREVIPLYRKLWGERRVELTTSPFYHPILPLLYSRGSQTGFDWLEDARAQLVKGLELFQSLFGRRPRGLWPSEGSVSQEVAEILSQEGMEWFASDEDILLRSQADEDASTVISSLGKREELIYWPYIIPTDGKRISIFFRDRRLSDLIGFSYSGMDPEASAEDFVRKLRGIATHKGQEQGSPPVVSVILDGENPWEHYRDGGERFLSSLYERLLRDPLLEPITFGEYLDRFTPQKKIRRLFAGSWIDHDFRIWYDHEEDKKAWHYLAKTREFLQEEPLSPSQREQAWREIYAAEGSDWFWWFGDEFFSPMVEVFDFLFRTHLMNVYHIAGKRFPAYLKKVIKESRRAHVSQVPLRFISPVIDGKITTFYEWVNAGLYRADEPSEVMQRSEEIVQAIYYGFDLEKLYLRVDFDKDIDRSQYLDFKGLFHLSLQKGDHELEFRLFSGQVLEVYRFEGEVRKKTCELEDGVRVDWVAELQLPFRMLEANPGDEVNFSFFIRDAHGVKVEEWPKRGLLSFRVPDQKFEILMWNV